MEKQIKLSMLEPNEMVDCEGLVVSVNQVKEMIKNGVKVSEVYMLTPEFFKTILAKSLNEYEKGNKEGYISAPNKGQKVIIDI